jgi:hypothetical protein
MVNYNDKESRRSNFMMNYDDDDNNDVTRRYSFRYFNVHTDDNDE